MQQAIHNAITIKTATATTGRRVSLGRRIAQTWDLAGALALIDLLHKGGGR